MTDDDNTPRTFTFEKLTAIRTGWTEAGFPCLVLSENPNPAEPQGRDLKMMPLDIGRESVVVEFRSPVVLLQFYEALAAISRRMAEQSTAPRQ